ncbi:MULTISPECIES: rhamnulokinase [Dictyoglomus]|jgi:rhamnulokinase|uniref:rhamnulokinase n=1 Tax=Dictyoglomus turgidum (strain DSM 6724 / Z-1310) TaxID=515635 RepID=B8E1U7_DICTD|nr:MULTISPECIES: rhamnulokinase family protein [Dictyoglomus]ACK41730.1 carbohydrate kinase FGGY [Dictyoglomus turgidum DSM 6724]PNV79598.1 MAG: rhamnulokinase [Dictyoglomus turgidum]HBU31773.1 rhamnulokinase [Dictyoglomus sp.]
MEERKFLAIDLGAESGRLIVGILRDGRLAIEEVHRFINRPVDILGRLYWNVTQMFQDIKDGLVKAFSKYKDIESIGIDTWGVDFGLVTKEGYFAGIPVCYRDHRTDGILEKAFEVMPKERIYELTGIQIMQINTLFQLYSMVLENSSLFNSTYKLLFMPDLFNFMLTGEIKTEFSIATTSQIYNPIKDGWEEEILRKFSIPKDIMPEVVPPGTVIGKLYKGIEEDLGVKNIHVIAPCEHDTGCAVVGVPGEGDDWAYISSGTWSLMGVELKSPIINNDSLRANFTNEGGYNKTFRFLKNIMGLWLLQRVKREWAKEGEDLSYTEITRLAEEEKPFKYFINPDDVSFLNPTSMVKEIQDYCKKTGQKVPEKKGEIVRCILESLAFRYKDVFTDLERILNKKIKVLHIVGGGSQNQLLSQFTADVLGIPVITGPKEATALGNIVVQAITKGVVKDIIEARKIIRDSSEMKVYQPQNTEEWLRNYEKYKEITQGVN